MSAIFNDPPFFGGLCNPDIQANKFTPLNLGQGSGPAPPSGGPGNLPLLEEANITSSMITLYFYSTNITGYQPMNYICKYGIKGTGLTQEAEFIEDQPTHWTTSIGRLQAGTDYEVQLAASNQDGNTLGVIQEFSTDPSQGPQGPLGDPTVSDAAADSIILHVDFANVINLDNATYVVKWGLSGGQLDNMTGSSEVNATYFICTIDGLEANTAYDFEGYVSTQYGYVQSGVSTFSTIPNGFGPTGPPTTPYDTLITSSSITVYFDIDTLDGDPTPSISIEYGTTVATGIAGVAQSVSGGNYTATVTGLQANTTYYFQSVASNVFGSVYSAVSDPITTDAAT